MNIAKHDVKLQEEQLPLSLKQNTEYRISPHPTESSFCLPVELKCNFQLSLIRASVHKYLTINNINNDVFNKLQKAVKLGLDSQWDLWFQLFTVHLTYWVHTALVLMLHPSQRLLRITTSPCPSKQLPLLLTTKLSEKGETISHHCYWWCQLQHTIPACSKIFLYIAKALKPSYLHSNILNLDYILLVLN